MERTKKSLETRLKKLNSDENKDSVVTFEELGVDMLYVDEAHGYKNLACITKMRNVAGINTVEAKKSSDGIKWRTPHYLSLGGISEKMTAVPRALVQYLTDHPSIRSIHLMLDNDKAGRGAACHIAASLGESYDVKTAFPAHGKDFNDEARWMAEHTERQQEQAKAR